MASKSDQEGNALLPVEFSQLYLTDTVWTQTGISFPILQNTIGAGGTTFPCNQCLEVESEKVVVEPGVMVSRYVQTDVEVVTIEEEEPEKPAR